MHLRGYPSAREMATATLDRLAAGGVYDRLGGGFRREATDGGWLVPPLEEMVPEIRRRLSEPRGERIRTGTDDKIRTAWNGLAIAAVAEGGRALGEQAYVGAAMGAFRFFQRHLVVDGGVRRAWRAGRVSGPGY